jgi:hypothetical protein
MDMKKWIAVMFFTVAVMVFAGCASTETAGKSETAAGTQAAATGSNLALWTFESGTTDGWTGKGKWAEALTVVTDPKFVKEGKSSLKLNSKGSVGYNQDIAVFECPCNENFGKLKAITMDVFVPAETMKGQQYLQIFMIINGSADNWYQIPQPLKAGWNSLRYDLKSESIDGDIWKIFLVVNNDKSTPLGGALYIDNIQGVM